MPGNGPTALNDIVIKRLCDALKRGNTRVNACRLARVSERTFADWMRKARSGHEDYAEFAVRLKEAEAQAEDEAMERIRGGAIGWQGMGWWLQRRNRARWGDITPAAEKAKILQAAANSNNLDDVSLQELDQAILDAADFRRELAKKNGTDK